MEHYRVNVLEDTRIKDTRLTKRYPILESRLCDNMLGSNLAYGIVIVDADFNRVTRSAPMDGRITVAGLCNRAYVNDLDCVRIGLSLNGVNDVLHSSRIGLYCSLREIVGSRRNHSADVKNDVRACYTLANIIVICKVAPNNFDGRIVLVVLELNAILFASSEEKNKVVLILSLINLLKTGISHIT